MQQGSPASTRDTMHGIEMPCMRGQNAKKRFISSPKGSREEKEIDLYFKS